MKHKLMRLARLALAAVVLSPASAFIAYQYRADDDIVSPSEIAANVQTVTGPTTPTTLLGATFAATSIIRDGYPAFGLSFERPKHWRSQTFGDGHTAGSTAPIAYLSEDELSDPCAPSTTGETECGWPIDVVSFNTPLIIWTYGADPAPTPNTLVGGQPARVGSAKPGACSEVKAEETIVAAIAKPGGGVFYMQACLSGSELEAAEQNVYAMLASVRID